MRKPIITIWTTALLLVGAMAFAQPGPGAPGNGQRNGPGNGPGQGPNGGLIEFLALDDAQIEAWTAFHDEFRATVEPLKEMQRDLHVQLREALDSDTPDAMTIGQLMIDIHAIGLDVRAAREQLDENLKSILTADQLVKFEAFRAAQAQNRRGGPGGGPGGPGKGGGGGQGPGNGPGTCS